MVGLPGTGLGGIFYALLVLWMAARESWLALRGASNLQRWLRIGPIMAILGCILAALWLEGWVIKTAVEALPAAVEVVSAEDEVNVAVASEAGQIAAGALAPTLAIASFVVLGLLLAGLHLARLVFPRQAFKTVRLPAMPQKALQSFRGLRDYAEGEDEIRVEAAE